MILREIFHIMHENRELQDEMEILNHDLELAEIENSSLMQDLDRLRYEINKGDEEIGLLKAENEICREIFRSMAQNLNTSEQLKRFYNQAAPLFDPDGHYLYRAAVEITHIDLYSKFAYEDNMGVFEEKSGRELLKYLECAYFHAVKWEVVDGTIFERATLLPIDYRSEEYREYQSKLYPAVMEKLQLCPPEMQQVQKGELNFSEQEVSLQ